MRFVARTRAPHTGRAGRPFTTYAMKHTYDRDVRKRPVSLTINEDLVSRAKSITDNLSGVVESLLADYVAQEEGERLAKSKAIAATISAWSEFADEQGSFADEHFTL
jgi:antitoxin CcdA